MLKPSMERAVLEIAAGHQMNDVAKIIKKHRSTIARWKKNPEFLSAIQSVKQELKERIIARHVSQ